MESPQFFCNKCLFPMKGSHPPFSLTQCGHLFCHSCSKKVTTECLNCKSPGVKLMPLVEPLPPSIAKLFVPISQLHERWQNHVKILTEQLAIANESVAKSHKRMDTMKKGFKDTLKRIEQEKQEIRLLQEKYDNLKAEKLNASFQEASISNAPATNFLNVDNSYQYQMNPHPAQNYARDVPPQHTAYFNNQGNPNESRNHHPGYNTAPESGQGSSNNIPVAPENINHIPKMEIPRRFQRRR